VAGAGGGAREGGESERKLERGSSPDAAVGGERGRQGGGGLGGAEGGRRRWLTVAVSG